MARKVFLSVLGSTNYGECKYVSEGDEFKSESVRFIQEAMLDYLQAKNWSNESAGYIFVTTGNKGSMQKNWLNDGHIDRNTKQPVRCEGLQSRLLKMELPFQIHPIEISDGNDENEIWEIFNNIYNCLSDNDEVYFDITHGFRFLPMLAMALLNYAKFLKTIKIRHISYGNYEGRDTKKNEAKIVNLFSLSNIQDWANSVNEFITSGNTSQLSSILSQNKPNKKGSESQALRKFSNALNNFTLDISTVRGKNIYSGKSLKDVEDSISLIRKKTDSKALNPILEMLEKKISHFVNTKDLRNGEIAVQWCLDHNLIQQAYTLGQEHIISRICNYLKDSTNTPFDYSNKMDREIVSATIGYITKLARNSNEKPSKLLVENAEKFEIVQSSELIKKIAQDFAQLTSFRNSINHGGMIGDITNEAIRNNFNKFYQPILTQIELLS